ncbi:MAG: NAD(P)-binding domain-containing protein, partial [Rhizobiales bacterium]|nr:NAD(P)-binding domain-containing protein [Hyphomicrobiales bacterium]
LGAAIAHALLKTGTISPERLWIANRSGARPPFSEYPQVNITTDASQLAQACDTILLSVPPALFPEVAIKAHDKLVLSVMAGVTIAHMTKRTGASRLIRAMSSPAAELSLAYTPWCASPGVTHKDRDTARTLFEACGKTAEVANEDQIDYFTALTGPVPGFVAFFADAMIADAIARDVPKAIADRAVRQLFHAAGVVLDSTPKSPADHVEAMIAYAGTTAAGMLALRESPLARAIAQGLDAAYRRAKTIAPP